MPDQVQLIPLPVPEGSMPLWLDADGAGAVLLGDGKVRRFDGKNWTERGALALDAPVEGTVEDGRGALWAWSGDRLTPISAPGPGLTLPGRVLCAQPDGPRGLVFWLQGPLGLTSWRTSGTGSGAPGDLPALPDDALPNALLACGTTRLILSDGALGFRAWRLGEAGWLPMMEPGAGRHSQSARVLQAIAAGPRFIVVVAGPAAGPVLNKVPPPGVELLLIQADGAGFELLMGETRLSPEGLKLPASLLGPDFDEEGLGPIAGLTIAGQRLFVLEEAGRTGKPRLRMTGTGPDPSTWQVIDLPVAAQDVCDRLRPGLVAAQSGLFIAAAGRLSRFDL